MKSNRHLLGYFLESDLWKTYKEAFVHNYAYMVCHDPARAKRMQAAKQSSNSQGYTVEESIYDMMTCINDSNLRPSTKARLFEELEQLILYHEDKDTLHAEVV